MTSAEQIKIENVTFKYPGGEEPVLNDVSLTINKGEFVAIIGGNGSGKSTLCKLINGLIPHYYVGDFTGSATVKELNTEETKVADLSQHVGYVYQDFDNQLVRARVLEDASFAPLNFGYADYKDRGKRALELAGLTGHDDEFIWQLSGGQKHLLALAGAISLDPDILIMDEPIAQLDPFHAKEIYNVLKMLNEEYGKTIIVIEHHTEFIADYCKQVVLMDKGNVLWKKPTADALRLVDQLMERQIFPPQVTQAAYKLDAFSNKSIPITLQEALEIFPNQKYVEEVAVHGPTNNLERACLRPVVEMEQVSFAYKTITRSKKTVLNGIDLNINQGDRIALVGNNGAGKSSLMRLITGLVKPERGNVTVKGKNTRDYSPEKLADFVTYIYQNPEEMFIEDSVRKDVEFFLKARKIPEYGKKVDRILEQFELTSLQERDSRLMSGGQQRRASLAIGVAMNPSIILLDEPTANLDIATRKHITRLIGTLEDNVEAVLVATHDMQLVAEWANRIIVLKDGNVLHDGTRESVFNDRELLNSAGLNPPQIMELSRELYMSPVSYTVDDFVATVNKQFGEENSDGIQTKII
ncbi:ABC transporter ATP-binding protein [Oceanobacillus chungangensis]|uniref:Cobalt ABC transporter ATP-binding protein n=1 Tax=Oceanobacillus chungangensis TaxID=1229152 RepID=A0A3D8PHK6_9BACI|nr:energy-coupling factor transporter ATPase [Oceanobacillus chungangensis]RDW15550.1 cobalt ABC transporter ATP-binding protein [Oceanobacillus chungangensis]